MDKDEPLYDCMACDARDYDDALDTLAGHVTDMMREGWRPHGGVSVTALHQEGTLFFLCAQAMVRDEPKRKP